jgi:hypothetical protein
MKSLDKIRLIQREVDNPRNWENVGRTHIQSSLIDFRDKMSKLLGEVLDENGMNLVLIDLLESWCIDDEDVSNLL